VRDDGAIDLRLGDWREVLADVESCDAVITDPPYGARTHEKQDHGRHKAPSGLWVTSHGIGYGALTPDDAAEIAGLAGRCAGWFCAMTSHDLIDAYTAALESNGRYVFAPLAIVQKGMNVRLAGDGPSNWTVYMVVARPRSGPITKWGTLPGAYVGTPWEAGESAFKRVKAVVGGKPLWLMRAIIRDYTKPGDLIVDPCAGGGTTLIAAAMEGRRAIGAEIDPETYAKAKRRISAGYTPSMFA
jgi:site-specific DNA-methyltransferase (adenine-specific)